MEKESGCQEILVSEQEPQIGWIFNSATHNFDPPKDQIQFASRDLVFYQIECKTKKQICTEFYPHMVPYSNYPWYADYEKSQAKDIIYVRTTKVKEKKAHNDFECQPSEAVVTSLCYKASVDILLHFDKRVTDDMAKALYIYLSNILNGSRVKFLPPFIDRIVKVVNVYCKGNCRKYDNKSLFGLKEACRILQEHECELLTSVKVVNHLYTKLSDIVCISSKNNSPSSLSSIMNLPSINICENKSKFMFDNINLSGSGTLHTGSSIMNDGEYIKSKECSVSDAFKLRSLGRGRLLSGLNNKYSSTAKNYESNFKKENTNTGNSNIHKIIDNQESLNTFHVPKSKVKINSKESTTNSKKMDSESDDHTLNQNQIAYNYHKGSFHKDRNININESIEISKTLCTSDSVSRSSSKGRRCAVSDQIVESVANLNTKLQNDAQSVEWSLIPSPGNSHLEVMTSLHVDGIKRGTYLNTIPEEIMRKLEEEILHFAIVSNTHNSKTISKNVWELALIANYQLQFIQYIPSTVDDILVQTVHKVCQKNSIDPNDCMIRLSFCSTRPLRNAIEGALIGVNEIYIHAKQINVENVSESNMIKKGKKDINNNKLKEITCFFTLLCSWCNKMHKLERMSSKVNTYITDQDLMLRCTECDCEGWKHRNLNEDCDDAFFRVSPIRILQYTKKKLEEILLKHLVFGMKLDLYQALVFFLEGNEDNSYTELIMDILNFVNFQH